MGEVESDVVVDDAVDMFMVVVGEVDVQW